MIAFSTSTSSLTHRSVVAVFLEIQNIPLNQFAFELYFDATQLSIETIEFTSDCSVGNTDIYHEIDNTNGVVYVSYHPQTPYIGRVHHVQIANIYVSKLLSDERYFKVGNRTMLSIHG